MREVTAMQNNEIREGSINLTDLFRGFFKILRAFWWILLILALVGGGLNFWRNKRAYVPKYRSESLFTVQSEYSSLVDIFDRSYFYDSDAASKIAKSFPYLLSSDVMTERLKNELDTSYINGTITASSMAGTNYFRITVTSDSPEDAYDILNAVIEVYPQVSHIVSGGVALSIDKEPTVPTEPYNTFDGVSPTMKGAVAGLLLGAVIILLIALLTRTVDTEEEVRSFLNLHSLGSIPEEQFKRRNNSRTGLNIANPDSMIGEAFRGAKVSIQRRLPADAKVIMFTSTLAGEGKSTVATNIAYQFARDGKNVVIIDADLRKQSVANMLGMTVQSDGLGQFLENEKESEIHFMKYKDTSLYLLASDHNRKNPSALLSSPRFDTLVKYLKEQFDYVIIDTPPAGLMADAAAVAERADTVVYVIKSERTTKAHISDSVNMLSSNGVAILGFIMNGSAGTGRTSYDGYKRYSRYGRYSYTYSGRYAKRYGYTKNGYSSGYSSKYSKYAKSSKSSRSSVGYSAKKSSSEDKSSAK